MFIPACGTAPITPSALVVSVSDYNVDPTGILESTSGFAKAFMKLASVVNAGLYGLLYIPYGLYITDGYDFPGQFNLKYNFGIQAAGRHSTVWRLKPGANKPLIQGYTSSIDKTAAFASGPDQNNAMHDFSISD